MPTPPTPASPSAAAARPTVAVELFAGAAEAAGCRRLEIPWSGGDVLALRAAVAAACPALAALLERSAVAIADRYAADAEPVAAGAAVAVIPPVSGG